MPYIEESIDKIIEVFNLDTIKFHELIDIFDKSIESYSNNVIRFFNHNLVYSSGLRVGEVVRLKVKDIYEDRIVLHVVQGEGRKDRYTYIAIPSSIRYSK
ncbi:hypothetical protein D3Z33_12730 [Senegalia massiliensis]|uniref:Tyr recombinase domain-containing protein n=1 Tax=Senegalia massiliensis TaxID=1720316 RepID=A0A845R135_9CLOT|nr:hypothetical protein [Senegalia massiliensis]